MFCISLRIDGSRSRRPYLIASISLYSSSSSLSCSSFMFMCGGLYCVTQKLQELFQWFVKNLGNRVGSVFIQQVGVVHRQCRLDLLRLLSAYQQLRCLTYAASPLRCQSPDALIRFLLQSQDDCRLLLPWLFPWSSTDDSESFVACSHRLYWAKVFPFCVMDFVLMFSPLARSSAILAARRIHPHFFNAWSGVILCPRVSHFSIFVVVLGCVFIVFSLFCRIASCIQCLHRSRISSKEYSVTR